MDPWTGVGLLLSVLINFWQFNVNGELEAERDNFEAIAKQCSTNRNQERRTTIAAADARERKEAAMDREFAGQKQHTRGVLQNASDTCLDTDSILGSKLVDREKRATDNINKLWLQSPSKPYD